MQLHSAFSPELPLQPRRTHHVNNTWFLMFGTFFPRDFLSHFGFLLTYRTYIPRELRHEVFFCSFWRIHGNFPEAISSWGNRSHAAKCYILFSQLFSLLILGGRDLLAINEWCWVGYEELSRSRRVAEVNNTLRDLLNSSYPTKAEFINCFIIHSK